MVVKIVVVTKMDNVSPKVNTVNLVKMVQVKLETTVKVSVVVKRIKNIKMDAIQTYIAEKTRQIAVVISIFLEV